MNKPMASATAASINSQTMHLSPCLEPASDARTRGAPGRRRGDDHPAPPAGEQAAGNPQSDVAGMPCGRAPARASAGLAVLLLGTLLAGCVAVTPRPPTVIGKPQAPAVPQTAPPAAAAMPEKARLERVDFADLPGWQQDDVAAGWRAFLRGCGPLRNRPDWARVCEAARDIDAQDDTEVRRFLESRLVPHRVVAPDGRAEGLLTGYYEPLLRGSRIRNERYAVPLYTAPDDLVSVDLSAVVPETKNLRLRGRVVGRKLVPYWSRAEIDNGSAALEGRELLWVDDPVDLFFLQVQGSGRVELEDGEIVRVGYADQNGHPYRSIGRLLVERGELGVDQASMQGIKAWGRANPEKLDALLRENPSYVFFRELPPNGDGPFGSLGVALTARRSIAVDPSVVPLGVPVFIDSTLPGSAEPLQQLMAAQDTGGAIKGSVRADFFWGFGPEAGEQAGRMRQPLRLWVLLPRDGA
jgi:membrane-bound lytic murein transglycosylase A